MNGVARRAARAAVVLRVSTGALLVGVVLIGCGVSTETSPHPIPSDRLPAALQPQSQPTTTLGPSPEPFAVWLVGENGLVRVTHRIEPPVTPAAVLASLAAGPTDVEVGESLRSAIADPKMIVDVVVAGGTATVDLDASFDQIPATDQVLAIGQMVLTLTNQRGIGQVRFELAGAEVAVPLPDGRTVDAAVSADDYRTLEHP